MIAVVDVGSNSVRLMLWADGKSLFKRIKTTRLGQGIKDCRLAAPSMERSAEAVSFFCGEALKAGAERVFVFATAAVRMAENKSEFFALVKERCGLDIDLISGKEEAELAALGALGKEDGTVIDVGGASSEIISKERGKTVYAESFQIGAVTLREHCRDIQSETEEYIKTIFATLPRLSGKVYAVGGTATALACLYLKLKEYDAEKVQNCFIAKAELKRLKDELFSLGVEERKKLIGMEESRADVIAGGAGILCAIADKIGAEGIYISDRDNLEGYLYARGIV